MPSAVPTGTSRTANGMPRLVPKLGPYARMSLPPRAGQGDVVILLLAGELGALHGPVDEIQAPLQPFEVRDDHPDVAAELLGVALRQVELLLPDIDPHVERAKVDVRVACEPQAGDVEQRGDLLVRHGEVDVLHVEDVAEILFGAVESPFCHGSSRQLGRRPAWLQGLRRVSKRAPVPAAHGGESNTNGWQGQTATMRRLGKRTLGL